MTALPSGTRLGSYQVVALIGAGSMGEVYRARDTRLNRDVAQCRGVGLDRDAAEVTIAGQ
jgi:hypothetical protein